MQRHHFADRLIRLTREKNTPLIVGLDPRFSLLPASLRDGVLPYDHRGASQAIEGFCREIIDVVSPLVAAVKPQAAFFEKLGPPGMLALGRVIEYAQQAELLVILDGKRNDIGVTAAAYAEAYLGQRPESAWGCDALTVNPYLGVDSLEPMIDRCLSTGSGIFSLVKTSNPGSNTIQDLSTECGLIYEVIGRWIQERASATKGASDYGVIGAVVGATHPQHLSKLRSMMPNTLFLVPGFGAQGGTAENVRGAFDSNGLGAVVNSSRQIIFAFNDDRYSAIPSWQRSVEQSTRDSIDLLRTVSNPS